MSEGGHAWSEGKFLTSFFTTFLSAVGYLAKPNSRWIYWDFTISSFAHVWHNSFAQVYGKFIGDCFLLFCFWYFKNYQRFQQNWNVSQINETQKDVKTSSIDHICLAMRNSMTYLWWYLALGSPSYFICTLGTNVHISCSLLSSVKMARSRRRACKKWARL